MKQILQNLKSGLTEITEVPCPGTKAGHLLIQTRASLISAGTERMLVDFGKASYLQKARQQPDKVKQVLAKIRTDGLMPTINAVRSKLDQPIPLGYCNVGTIVKDEKAFLPSGFSIGDRVVSNGPHAEVVCVAKNLCARVPDAVRDEEAAFAVGGAIALQGVRLAKPTLGEYFIVTGLGLIGLMTVQILQANGCNVLGIDFDPVKCDIASRLGAETVNLSMREDAVAAALAFSKGRGIDGVLITAATKSNEPVHQAAQMCRKRGRIVLVGVSGLELNRADFYEKELSFQVSCSYGPGRYDPNYEEKGIDYPIGFVRWTEQRNFEAVLNLMAAGKLNVKPLISHGFKLEDAQKAYKLIADGKEPYLGILITYGDENDRKGHTEDKTVRLKEPASSLVSLPSSTAATVGMIGAGNFTGQMLLPALKKTGARLKAIASGGGITGTHLGKKFGFEQSTTDVKKILRDREINTVFITTQHDTHARFALESLHAGKNVFIEKPLCLTLEELNEFTHFFHSASCKNETLPLFIVGFNRRFAPHIVKMKELLNTLWEPKSLIMTVNAGYIPDSHWTQDPKTGGGRIIGEACHFVDLLRFLTGKEIKNSKITKMKNKTNDTVSITLSFVDGSVGTIHYFANGNKGFPKERLEIFCEGKILQLDNFKLLRGYGWKNFKKMKLWRQDKGHVPEVAAFIDAVKKGGPSPIPFEEIVEVTKTTIKLTLNTHK